MAEMIDREADVFDRVARAVLEVWPDAYVTDRFVQVVPRFPAVSIWEASNASTKRFTDSAGEHVATLAYDVNTYSNLDGPDGKAEAKAVFAVVDRELRAINAVRQYSGPTNNALDPTLTRYNARYTVNVGDDGLFYSR